MKIHFKQFFALSANDLTRCKKVKVLFLNGKQPWSSAAFLNPNCCATHFYWIFFNFIEGRDPFKVFHDPFPGCDPVVEKPWPSVKTAHDQEVVSSNPDTL
jgi:hypothetical protein